MDFQYDDECVALEFYDLTQKCSLLSDNSCLKAEFKELNRYSNIQPCNFKP